MKEKETKTSGKRISIRSSRKLGHDASLSFWAKLPRPFFVLAPMANVTDFAFRSMIAKYGKPDVIWTEFVSADGLDSTGKAKLLIDLKFSDKERPIVAQLFGSNPEAMRKAVALCVKLGFDGVDINMGCPDRSVEKQGGGAAMMKDAKKALAVLMAAREGWFGFAKGIRQNLQINKKSAFDPGESKQNEQSGLATGVLIEKNANATMLRLQNSTNTRVPISIKTRIGYNKVDFDWLRLLLEQNLPALTVHLRTRKEMSDVPAHWELMPEIVKLRDEIQADLDPTERTLIIGNGDVGSIAEAVVKARKSGCDGVMIGRGIFGKPWLFGEIEAFRGKRRLKKIDRDIGNCNEQKTPAERLKIMVEHAKLFEKNFNKIKNFAIMRKHFKAYVSGWDGAKELRVKLMETENATQVDKIVKEYLKDFAKVPPRY